MELDGQAGDGPGGIDAIERLLLDNPGITGPEADEEEAVDQTSDGADKGDPDEGTDAPAQDEGDKPESEDADKQASGQKFKVPVKGDDGVEREEEVTEQELIAGYQRHADYTRKTMALADRDREAFQVVTGKIHEYRDHYVQQAQTIRATLLHAAGVRSAEEMAMLASTDPSAWVQENQRQLSLQGFVDKIDQSLRQEEAQAQHVAREQMQASRKHMASVLAGEGFDIPKLQNVFQTANKVYGFSAEQLQKIDDPALVRMMRDAAEYQALKAKKAEVIKKPQDTAQPLTKLPNARRPVPKSEQVDKQLSTRFRSGKAGLSDLTAYLQHRKL